ncbi:putative armadillo-like helical protein [Helianthus anomalus]
MEFALEKIMAISQEGIVKEYCNSFQILFDQVKNLEEMSEFYAIYIFIFGLEPGIRKIFAKWHQYSCTKVKDVISLALKIDSSGLQDSFSPFDPNSSFYNKDLEFNINITLEELMKDNVFFKNGKIQEVDIICDESIVFVQELGDNEFLGTDFSKNLHGSESLKQDVSVESERVNFDNNTTVSVILYDQENIGLKARFDMVKKSLDDVLLDPLVVLNREGVVVEKIQVRKKWYVKLHSGDIQYGQFDVNEDSSIWICALLLAVLFQDIYIIRGNKTIKSIPTLASLLRSEESANRYFAAQATTSLVCHRSRGTLLSVANSGAAVSLISLLGCADADICDLLQLSEEFSPVPYPVGATSRKAIPALVDLLKPIPDRPGAPFLALGLLIQLRNDSPSNKVVIVESNALEALTKYLSLGPQESTEEAAPDLLGILFSTAEIRRHESAYGVVIQLIAVLRMGGRGARYSAAKALENLFCVDHIRNADSARHVVQPLVEVLNSGLEIDQHAAIAALVRLLSDNPSRALAVADVEMNAVDAMLLSCVVSFLEIQESDPQLRLLAVLSL